MSRFPDPLVPWAVYDPDGNLIHIGMHTTHMAAWVGYLGEDAPYPKITEHQLKGYTCQRVRVEPIATVVGLRRPSRSAHDHEDTA